MESFNLKPIGFFHANEVYPQQLTRQAVEANGNTGYIELKDLFPLRQALDSLEGCKKIWVIYLFHKNKNWKPKVYPPRGSDKKVGLFATRAPYRPNPIGISCVDLVSVKDNKIFVENHDILNASPILDIKPYLSFSDSFEGVQPAWQNLDGEYSITYSSISEKKISWLDKKMKMNLETLLKDQLSYHPLYKKRKRIREKSKEGDYEFSYRTWRFDLSFNGQSIYVKDIYSGYTKEEIINLLDDPYKDKALHMNFRKSFATRREEKAVLGSYRDDKATK